MTNLSLAADLVAERQHRLHAEAAGWRLARRARRTRRAQKDTGTRSAR